MGGTGEYPNYENYTAANNYSETLRLVYDPSTLGFADILDAYWRYAPDPTMPEPDPAYQLRIFWVDDAQKAAAEASIAAQKKATPGTLVTLLSADEYTFWKAEEVRLPSHLTDATHTCKPGLPRLCTQSLTGDACLVLQYHQHYFDKGGQQCTSAPAQLPSRGRA